MKTVFDLCEPRQDVLKSRMKDEKFAADLTSVVRPKGTKIREYTDPAVFFRYTYPTQGLKALLEAVCRRLSGKGGWLQPSRHEFDPRPRLHWKRSRRASTRP